MLATIGEMTTSELKTLISTVVEQKLLDLLDDPDLGMRVRQSMHKRLLRQQQAVAAGERGESFDDVIIQLGLG